jgi:hypothetical protein
VTWLTDWLSPTVVDDMLARGYTPKRIVALARASLHSGSISAAQFTRVCEHLGWQP